MRPNGDRTDPEPPHAARHRTDRRATRALALGGIGFVLLSLLAMLGATAPVDHAALGVFRTAGSPGESLGPAWLGQFFLDITRLGGRAVLGLLGVLVAGFLAIGRDWRGVAFLALAFIGATAMVAALKASIARARPDLVPHLDAVSSFSFPSGHATYSAVACLVFCILLFRVTPAAAARAYFAGAAAFVVALVGVSRVWLGVHYPSDVLAGWCLATAWVSACWLAVDRFGR